MRISISGAQSTGKTTLINELSQLKEFKDYTILKSPSRFLYLNYDMKFDSANTEIQLAILTMQAMNTLQYQDSIFDRSLVDNLAYLKYYKERGKCDIRPETEKFIYDISSKLLAKIDYHFLLVPEFNIMDDGVRVVDIEQQQQITQEIKELFVRFKIDFTTVTGNIADRVSQVLWRLERYGYEKSI